VGLRLYRTLVLRSQAVPGNEIVNFELDGLLDLLLVHKISNIFSLPNGKGDDRQSRI
jgi:hypothetical protein